MHRIVRVSVWTLASLSLIAVSCSENAGTSPADASSQGSADTGPARLDAGPGHDAGPGQDAGIGVPFGHCGARQGRYFPADSWIYADITNAPVRGNSAATTAWLESHGGWGNGNHFQIDTSFVITEAASGTPRIARAAGDPMEYSEDCDPNVSVPLPPGGRIEGRPGYDCDRENDDCHLIVVDSSSHTLFEAYQAAYVNGLFYTTCTIAWDMTRDVWGSPPAPGSTLPPATSRNWGIGRDCTGPDAAGFPIAPLLFTMGDVLSGRVEHAIRFALPNDSMQRAPTSSDKGPVYVWPATHAGGPSVNNANAPIYGSRWRLKANFDPSSRGLDATNPIVAAVVYGLKHHGMLLADGGEVALMAEDATGCSKTWENLWGDPGSRILDGIRPSDFEIIDTGGLEAGWDCLRNGAR